MIEFFYFFVSTLVCLCTSYFPSDTQCRLAQTFSWHVFHTNLSRLLFGWKLLLKKDNWQPGSSPRYSTVDVVTYLNRQFRIGNHKLTIETGRYDQIPRVNIFPLFVHLIKLKTNLTFLYIAINILYSRSILRNKFYEKIEHIIPTFKQLSSLWRP